MFARRKIKLQRRIIAQGDNVQAHKFAPFRRHRFAMERRVVGRLHRNAAQRRDHPLARRRIALSWIFAAAFLLLARPTPLSVAIGLVPVTAGALLRTWASGHIRKLQKLATAGPYAHTRNPLYAGSFLIAAAWSPEPVSIARRSSPSTT